MTAEEIQFQWDNSKDWKDDYFRLLEEAKKIGYEIKGFFANKTIPNSTIELKKLNAQIKEQKQQEKRKTIWKQL